MKHLLIYEIRIYSEIGLQYNGLIENIEILQIFTDSVSVLAYL